MIGQKELMDLTIPLVEYYIENTGKVLIDLFGGKINNAKIYFKTAFVQYLKNSVRKYSLTKTILYRDTPVPLKDFYVDIFLQYSNKKIDSSNLASIIAINNFIIITGTAGSGKSTLMKNLFLNSLSIKGYIPLFIELRSLNFRDGNLVDSIHAELINLGFKLEKEYFIRALENGNFILFLDGFDEINPSKKEAITKEITEIADKYQKNYFIVSSRPDDSFIAWNKFSEIKMLPLTKDQAIELITRIKYDKQIQARFISALKEQRMFEKHASFLSNPLLLTIMLISYSQYAEIPSKMHIFYSQAFDALFSKHDATKGGYKRKMYTVLPVDDFIKIISCFSILTWFDHLVTFDSNKLLEYLKSSRDITSIDFPIEDFVKDLLKSVCILTQDGVLYTFTHKTFQEYFTARYIADATEDVKKELLNKIEIVNKNDLMVLSLLNEMDSEFMGREFFIPRLEHVKQLIKYQSISDKESLRIFVQNLFSEVEINLEELSVVYLVNRESNIFDLMRLVSYCFKNDELGIKMPPYDREKAKDQVKNLIGELKKSNEITYKDKILTINAKQVLSLDILLKYEEHNFNSILKKMMKLLEVLKIKQQKQSNSIKTILLKKTTNR